MHLNVIGNEIVFSITLCHLSLPIQQKQIHISHTDQNIPLKTKLNKLLNIPFNIKKLRKNSYSKQDSKRQG